MESPDENLGKSMIAILLEDMEINVRIGLLADEKTASQRLRVSVSVYLDAAAYLAGITPETIFDYALLYAALKSWEQRGHVLLLETYARELLDLCFEDPRVQAARVRIAKPDIFPEAAQAGLEVFIQREDRA